MVERMQMTIKQIADELNIDKQKVYRYIKKNHINEVHHEAHQKSSVMYYDEAVLTQIKQEFCKNEPHQEVHHEAHQNHINEAVFDAVLKQSEILQNELEVKNEQIAQFQKLLDQQQQLTAQVQQKLSLLEEKNEEPEAEIEPPKKWWQLWK